MENNNCLVEDMRRYIGQTVTIFTTSGGAAGCGFTGVLICVDCGCIRLLNCIGEAPSCPIGSSCCCGFGCGSSCNNGYSSNWGNGCGWGNNSGSGCGSNYGNSGCGNGWGNSSSSGCGNRCGNSCNSGSENDNSYGNGYGYVNPLGAVTEIPICNIASFTHNAI